MKKISLFILSIIIISILTACGTTGKTEEKGDQQVASESDVEEVNTDSEEQQTSIEVTDASGQTLTFDSVPQSASTLSSGDLDILFNLDVNITGRPTTSAEVPEEFNEVTEIGNLHQPNFERIAEVNPEVLIAPLSFQRHAENIEEQGTKVLYTNANSVADIQETITMFGQVFQKEIEAEEINSNITEKIESINTGEEDPVQALLVYGTTETSLAALPNSLSGDLLEQAGGENIASDFESADNYPQYANLSPERIIERNPEVVMLITHGDPEAVKDAFELQMSTNAAWSNIDAVQNGNIIVLPSDLFGSNPGTKVADALETMKANLEKVK